MITGTCQDVPSGPSNIGVTIQRADSYYWDVINATWTNVAQVWNSTSSFTGGVWQVAIPTSSWTDGTNYALQVKVHDNVTRSLIQRF